MEARLPARRAAMLSELTTVLEELREDHRNLTIMLDMTESQLLEMESGGVPDLPLLNEIMRYMTTYPDSVHHPKEDLVYDELRNAGDEFTDGLDNVADDHREIAILGWQLRRDIEAAISGAAVTRERLTRDTIDYVRRLRKHIAWEEADLFPRADRLAAIKPVTIDLGQLSSAGKRFLKVPRELRENSRSR